MAHERESLETQAAAARESGHEDAAAIDLAHAAGEIDDREWHRRTMAIAEALHLATDSTATAPADPDAWERARRLLLDGVPGDGSFLDVGCADGLLMASVEEWARSDGRTLTAYGVEISTPLAARARRAWPGFAERVWCANAMDWPAPRRFDVVRTGLDYVPPGRRRAYVHRLLRDLVEPGGRLLVGVHAEERDRDTIADQLRAWGLGPAGAATRPHPVPGLDYKVVWVDRTGTGQPSGTVASTS